MKKMYLIGLSAGILTIIGVWVWSTGIFHNQPLKHAAENRQWEKVITLVRQGENPNIYLDTKKTGSGLAFSPLTAAIKDARYDVVLELLQHHADPRQVGMFGIQSLHIAVENPDFAIIKLLLDSGTNPNETNRMNEVPVWRDLDDAHLDILTLFVQKGANITQKSDGVYEWDYPEYKARNPRAYAYLQSEVQKLTQHTDYAPKLPKEVLWGPQPVRSSLSEGGSGA